MSRVFTSQVLNGGPLSQLGVKDHTSDSSCDLINH